MPVTDSPLRYPGGKSQLIPFIIDLMRKNDLFYGQYAEPFAGGAGVPLKLLLDGYVDKVYINDFDEAIYSFWASVLEEPEELSRMIRDVKVDIDTWREMRRIYFDRKEVTRLELGFSTLFLNRTNRSGIIKAGVIGGVQQLGKYKLDCRFNKDDLIRKIMRIAGRRDGICLTNLDALDFLDTVIPNTDNNILVNLDPPYFGKGKDLYANYYNFDDHQALAEKIYSLGRKWIVTYDDVSEIRDLYSHFPMYTNQLNYSAQVKRVGTELLVAMPGLVLPEGTALNPVAL
ncbi:hypothetical protein TH25_04650 [Thalassospira profundimaris]|uniref:site-specific DNA-methyltransferase (adenine-specific) n=1 Tax=Thalassospira profundimaris TaxID=502049 RepID=A0A367XK35_9PROT|nr:DNA adenine methylase [Thalassospira profundimaris]RCK53789.1 hypothetical protein TH25_04650 [Thalassospira profundimaris]